MSSRVRKSKTKWVVVQEYAAKPVVNVMEENLDGTSRQHILRGCEVGMKINLLRDRENDDPNAVAVLAPGGQQIGLLETEVAEWVAPALASDDVDVQATLLHVWSTPGEDDKDLWAADLKLVRLEKQIVETFSIFRFVAVGLMTGIRWIVLLGKYLVRFLAVVCKTLLALSRKCLRVIDALLVGLSRNDKTLLLVLRVAAYGLLIAVIGLVISTGIHNLQN